MSVRGTGSRLRRSYVKDFVDPTNVVESEMLSIELQYGTESSNQYSNERKMSSL